jgi:C_GCAxxG_C_C family probable redox protein
VDLWRWSAREADRRYDLVLGRRCTVEKGMSNQSVQAAEELFLQGYNCAQAVCHACAGDCGVPPELIVKLATGFGAGMARAQETCGAVTGGILALGLRGGRALGDDKARTEETYAAVRSLQERFAAKHGSCLCRELLGECDLRTEAGQREFKEKGYLRSRCLEYVKTAAELVG